MKIGIYHFHYTQERRLPHEENGSFLMDGKKCTAAFFKKTPVQEWDDDVSTYRDENGRLVLRIDHSIPTFDSGDREWNSYEVIYLFKEKEKLTGIYLTGGYRLACVKKYSNIEGADERTRNLLEKMWS